MIFEKTTIGAQMVEDIVHAYMRMEEKDTMYVLHVGIYVVNLQKKNVSRKKRI